MGKQNNQPQNKKSRSAVVVASVAFSVYLSLGHLDFLPDWIPLAITGAALIYWLATEPGIRVTLSEWFTTEPGLILNPETNKPAISRRIRKPKVVTTAALIIFLLGVGIIASWYRAQVMTVSADASFVFMGAKHPLFSPSEIYETTILLSIDNKSRYATGLTSWEATLKFPDGRTAEGVIGFKTDQDVPVPLGTQNGNNQWMQFTLKPPDYLPTKAAEVIQPGGGIWGWLPAMFPGYTRKDVRGKGAMLIIHFREIATGKLHVVTNELDAHSADLPPGIFPIRLNNGDNTPPSF